MKWFIGIVALLALASVAYLALRKSNSELAQLDCDDTIVRDLAFSADGLMIVGVGESGNATAWGLPGFAKIWSSDCGAKPRSLAILDSKGWVAIACDDAKLHLLDAATGSEVRNLKMPSKAARLAASPDGRRLAAGTLDGRILVWDVSATSDPRIWKPGGKHIHALAFAPDSETLVAGDDKGNLLLLNATTGKMLNSVSLGRQHIHDVQISGEPPRLAVAMAGKGVLVGPLADLNLDALPGEVGMALTAALSPDGTKVATGHEDGSVRLWNNGAGGKVIGQLKKTVVAVRFSPDGHMFAAAAADGKIHIWPTSGR